MSTWTAETVLALAPDASSVTAGRGLADPGKWASAGANEAAAWGEAKGSGSNPYRVTVDLGDGASKCSCPSRKFPCKHALGLMLRVAKGDVLAGEPPNWASEWLQKRGEKAAAPKAPPTAPSVKTVERRWDTVLKGLEECEGFLRDAVGNGLLNVGSARSWDEMAARMVDAQAPGVARKLRAVGSAVGVDDRKAAAELGSLGLLIEAARRVEMLNDLGHDVRVAIGVPTRKEEAVEIVDDVWDVLGEAVEVDDRLTGYRSWLRGRESGRWALRLEFAHPNAPAPSRLLPGFAVAGEARFFPSAWPLRAHFDTPASAPFGPTKGGNWAEALEAQADALAINPWVERFPVHLTNARLGADTIIDADERGLSFRLNYDKKAKLLAYNGNAPSEFFGELVGERFVPLAAWGPWGQVTL